MDNNPDDQLIIIKSKIEANIQASDAKMKKYDSKLDKIMEMIKNTMDQNQN